MATVNYWAADHAAAIRWYSDLLGVGPYFERPGYAEFRVGDHENELGLIDSRYSPENHVAGPGGAVLHWHVDDVQASVDRLLSMGAEAHQPVTSWGPAGFVTASVVDPFGNVLGVMFNPHYLEMLGRR